MHPARAISLSTAVLTVLIAVAACGNSFTDLADAGPDAPVVDASGDTTAGETGPDARGLMGPEAGADTDQAAEAAAPDAATFDPSQIAGCILWLRADRGVTADANGSVSVWANQCGTANTVRQANSALQPVVGATFGPHGQAGISFDGARILTSSTTLGLSGGAAFSFFVVLKMASGTVLASAAQPPGGGPGGGMALMDRAGSREYNAINSALADFGMVTSAFELWELIAPNISTTVNSPSLYANGVRLFSDNVSFYSDTSAGGGRFVVGGSHTAGLELPSFQGVVSEIIGYDSALGDANRLRVEGYVNARYALY